MRSVGERATLQVGRFSEEMTLEPSQSCSEQRGKCACGWRNGQCQGPVVGEMSAAGTEGRAMWLEHRQ